MGICKSTVAGKRGLKQLTSAGSSMCSRWLVPAACDVTGCPAPRSDFFPLDCQTSAAQLDRPSSTREGGDPYSTSVDRLTGLFVWSMGMANNALAISLPLMHAKRRVPAHASCAEVLAAVGICKPLGISDWQAKFRASSSLMGTCGVDYPSHFRGGSGGLLSVCKGLVSPLNESNNSLWGNTEL